MTGQFVRWGLTSSGAGSLPLLTLTTFSAAPVWSMAYEHIHLISQSSTFLFTVRVLNLFCSCKSSGGARAFLLVTEITIPSLHHHRSLLFPKWWTQTTCFSSVRNWELGSSNYRVPVFISFGLLTKLLFWWHRSSSTTHILQVRRSRHLSLVLTAAMSASFHNGGCFKDHSTSFPYVRCHLHFCQRKYK